MNWFTVLVDALTFFGSPQGAALVQKLQVAGVDVLVVWNAVFNNSGLPAIEAALQKLLADVSAA